MAKAAPRTTKGRPTATPRSPAKARRPANKGAPKARERLLVDERRQQLLATGLEAFASRSYDDVAIEDIAAKAGISKGLLYHYFPSKRDFYMAALERAAETLLELTKTPVDLPPEERSRRGLEAYLDFVEKHAGPYTALMRGGIGSDPEVVALLERNREKFLERTLEDVPRELVTPLVRMALRGWIGFVEATCIEWIAKRGIPRSRVVELMTHMLNEVAKLLAEPYVDAPAPKRRARA
ncbi:MAG: TetR/AcrR family transcriptional regulator [Polyangiaceae bacterium]